MPIALTVVQVVQIMNKQAVCHVMQGIIIIFQILLVMFVLMAYINRMIILRLQAALLVWKAENILQTAHLVMLIVQQGVIHVQAQVQQAVHHAMQDIIIIHQVIPALLALTDNINRAVILPQALV